MTPTIENVNIFDEITSYLQLICNIEAKMRYNTSFIFALLFSITGCAQYTGAFTTKDYMRPPELFKYSATYTKTGTENNESIQLALTSTSLNDPANPPVISFDLIEASANSGNESATRDLLQDMLISRSDYLCGKFLDRMFIRITARQLTLDQIAMAANAVGGFSETIASEMNLVAGLATGTQTNYDTRILQEQMTQNIINKIRANRASTLKKIRTDRVNTNPAYTLSNALTDASKYHDQCSFIEAISSLSKGSNEAEKEPGG